MMMETQESDYGRIIFKKRNTKMAKKKKEILGITEEFEANVAAMMPQEIELTIVRLQKQAEDTNKFLKEEQAILEAREILNNLTASAKETLSVVKNRTKYLLNKLEELGKL